MPSFWKHVNKVLEESDLIIEVLDARMIEETRNKEIEKKVKRARKLLLYVINKCDLVEDINKMKEVKHKLKPSVFISSKDNLGTTILRNNIRTLAKGRRTIVGVVGYPNVGKSSLINALAKRSSAKTSSESSYTKGLQKVRIDSKIVMLDTPGVFTQGEKSIEYQIKHVNTGAISNGKTKNPEIAALTIIEENPLLVKEFYKLNTDSFDSEEVLAAIAIKYKKMQKGNNPDLEAAARMLLRDWQSGEMTKKR